MEEVNDNDISSEAFRRIRKTDQHTFNSMLTDGRSKGSSVTVGPLLEDMQMIRHGGSRIEAHPQSVGVASVKPSSCLSTILQDPNSSQFGDSRLIFKSGQRRSQDSFTPQGSPVKLGGLFEQRRPTQKTLISDLNKIHSSNSYLYDNSSEMKLVDMAKQTSQ